ATGKWTFARDLTPSPPPGSEQGHVLVTPHTYPDGAALGTLLLRRLEADPIPVPRRAAQTPRRSPARHLQLPADRPDSRYPTAEGPQRLAILVCSGSRSAGGHWSHRTIWFAKAVKASPAPR